jgi:Leucine-rich repeat (LRR) protein
VALRCRSPQYAASSGRGSPFHSLGIFGQIDVHYDILESEDDVGSVLIPRGRWTRECAERLSVGDVNGLRLTESLGFRDTDLAFLGQFPHLRSIEVYSTGVTDISPIALLPCVEVLGLQTKATTSLSASNFAWLRVAKLYWAKGMEGLLSASTLEYLNVVNFPYSNLVPLHQLTRLRRLSLVSRKLSSLEGIERCGHLEHIDLFRCPNLASLEPLARCPSVIRVEVESCPKIPNRG